MVSRPLIAQGYSLAEEVANSISHGIGLVFGIVGLVLLLVQAVDTNASAMAITSYSLYGGSMILLFLASTLYHAIPHQRAKIWLKKFFMPSSLAVRGDDMTLVLRSERFGKAF